MAFIGNKEENFWRNLVTRGVLVVLTVVVIVSFLPRTVTQTMHYDVGKPWTYGSFIAKFDFPVYKTDEAIKQEQDSMLALFQPYYNYDSSIEEREVGDFLGKAQAAEQDLPRACLAIVTELLHHYYGVGIMDASNYESLARDTTKMVRVVKGKQATSTVITSVYSVRSAYAALLADERLTQWRDALDQYGIVGYIEPNLVYDKSRSETERDDLLSGIPIASGMVVSGQKIIDRGEIVDDYTCRVLNSFEREMERRDTTTEQRGVMWGQALFVAIIVCIFTIYLSLFRKDYFDKARSITMLYLLLVLFPLLVSTFMKHNFLSVYIIPFAMVPMFVRMFMDSRTAFITHMTMVLICAAAVKYQYEFIIIQTVAGLVAIYSMRELSRRSQVFETTFLVIIASMLTYFSLQLMQNSHLDSFDVDMYYYILAGGFLLLLTYPLMFVVEKMFGFISDITLFELSNTNRGILRNLSESAPGTFQHSITVGNLAANIANRIGANALLVRTGALYHDIGKIEDPAFFTENQNGINPTKDMDARQAARIIINHVSNGIKIAETINLPQSIKDFILTHHGAGMARYFYVQCQNEHPDEVIDKADFSYPGPNPSTREQAILMMADACEAASRSLTEYTSENIAKLVGRIIDGQVDAGFFRECPITFRDITLAKSVLTERLRTLYHTRISYPELNKTNV